LGITPGTTGEGPYVFGNISYQRFYPIIDLEAGVQNRSLDYNVDNSREQDSVMTWNESKLSVGVRVPLNFTTNKFQRGVSLGAHATLTDITNYKEPEIKGSLEKPVSILSAEYTVSFYSLLKQSHRDVTSRLGITGFGIYRNTPVKLDVASWLYAAQARIKLPGILKHDGLQLRGGYSIRKINSDYHFTSPIMFTRGYSGTPLVKELYVGAVDYKFPIWNADLNLGSIINFQRFKGKIFYDRAYGVRDGISRSFESFGAEIHTDFNLLRWYPLLEMGVRYSYVPALNGGSFEFLLFQFDL
jgi:hypothetical protein